MWSAVTANAWVSDVALAWLPVLLDAAIKGLVVLALAWAATCLMRRSAAAARHLVWSLAVGSLAAMPLLSALLPGWNVLPKWTALSVTSADSVASAAPAPAAVPDKPMRSATSGGPAPAPGIAVPTPALPVRAPAERPAAPKDLFGPPALAPLSTPPLPPASWTWQIWALFAWLAGTVLTLVPFVLGLLSLRCLKRRAERITDGPWESLLRGLAARNGLRRRVTLLVSDRRSMPMHWGIVRPRLLLPASAKAWPADRVRLVLLHELGHVARWDCFTQLAARVVCALYWFNPLVWVGRWRMQLESEAACDDLSIQAGVKPSDYAEHLLEIASRSEPHLFATQAAIAMARRSRLEGRLLAILDPRRTRRRLTRLVLVAAVVGLAIVVVPLAMLHAGPEREEPEPAAEAAQSAAAAKSVASAEADRPPTPAPSTRSVWKEREDLAEHFILELLREERFDDAAAMFDPTLREILPAARLEEIWRKLGASQGRFDDAGHIDDRRFGDARLILGKMHWEKADLCVRFVFDEKNRISGLWLDRDPEGKQPQEFPEGGHRFGPPMERLAKATLSLEARIVGIDGNPVQKSSVGFMKAVEGQAADDEHCWHDPATARVWRGVGGAATGDRTTQHSLLPGLYRITASLGHGPSTPVGISDPIHLDGSQRHTVVTVRLNAGTKLTVRPVDAETGQPVPRPSVLLARQDDSLPPWWTYKPVYQSEPITFEHLPPGTYRLQAGLTPRHPDDLQYELVGGPIPVEIVGGEDREITIRMEGKPLDRAEIESRWPWAVTGQVTGEDGRPMQGVEVSAHCGMGTLLRTGWATTDANGRYTLRFGPGWRTRDEKTGRWGAGLQAATISPRKPGFVEKNLHRQGNCAMADEPTDKEDFWRPDPEQVILPGKRYRLDFVMVPAANIRMQLVDEAHAPIADWYVSVDGDELPPSSSVLRSSKTDADGRALFDAIPTGRSWWFTMRKEETRRDLRSRPFVFDTPAEHRIKLRPKRDAEAGIELLEIVSVTDSQGTEIRDQILRDDPFLRAPVGPELQAKGREILRKMAEVNRYWLGPPPPEVQSYQYDFCYAGRPPKTFQAPNAADAHLSIRQGTTYYSALHHLMAHPEQAVFRQVEMAGEAITLLYHLKKPAHVTKGYGPPFAWAGPFKSHSRGGYWYSCWFVSLGKLVIDPHCYTPVEHISGDDRESLNERETFSQYVEVRPGQYVPLRIRIDQGKRFQQTRYDWTFSVYEPGLWLFDASHTDRKEFQGGIIACIQSVKVNGCDGQVIHHAGKES